ncbi:peptidylprolyl isomerase [Patescibacteria group bacterium]|nr:peptidylprolyl isomerase [Patescibacteria group bacterium]MBU1895935.1 peptidylprolyl isomerase [Patescibacteria group bacterium]
MDEDIMKEEEKTVGSSSKTMGFIAGLVIILVLAFAGVYIYGRISTNKVSTDSFTLKIAGIFNFSAAEANGDKVLYTDYIEDVQVLNSYYDSNGDGSTKPSDEEISDQVISRLIANRIVAQEAKKLGAEVTDEDMALAESDLRSEFQTNSDDTTDIETVIMDRYGWTIDNYLQKVVRPIVLEQNLQKAFDEASSEDFGDFQTEEIKARHILFMVDEENDADTVKAEAQEVLDRIKDGEDFATLALEFGSDGTKDVGGDLGWFGRGMMVPEFEDAAFALEAGQLGEELVETRYGFHIIKVDEKRTKNDFVSYMDSKLKNSDIEIKIDIHNPFDDIFATEEVVQ